MKVLSLFDGISCGMVALERAGIKVDKYYASEIDPYAIKVSKENYLDIIQVGDITKWREWDIDWSSIDIIIGGSPCQDVSTLNRNRDGLNGSKSSLYFYYLDILNYIKQINSKVYFLLENNASMPPKLKKQISLDLEIDYININSSLDSCGFRNRLYWTNINNGDIIQPLNKHIKIDDCLEKHGFNNLFNEIKLVPYVERKLIKIKEKYNKIPYMFCPYNCTEITNKFYCLTAQGNSQTKSSTVICNKNNSYYLPNAKCWEIIQTLPLNYTAILKKENLRKTVIGNGWTVDVIAHIFSFLPDEYKIKEEL